MSQKPRHTGHNTDSGLHQIPPFEGIQVAPSQFPEAVRPPGDGLHNISTEIGLEPAPSSLAAEEKSVLEDRGVQRKRRLCGLRPITFWLLLVIVVLVIIGAVGGDVGGALASKRNNASSKALAGTSTPSAGTVITSATTTSSPLSTGPSPTSVLTSTSSASETSSKSSSSIGATPTTVVECPKVNGTVHTSLTGQRFRIRCGVDVTDGPDLNAILEYTVEDCIDACGNYNSESATFGSSCEAVTFNANLTSSIPGNHGNCFLKASTNGVSTNGADPILVASAFLLDSTSKH